MWTRLLKGCRKALAKSAFKCRSRDTSAESGCSPEEPCQFKDSRAYNLVVLTIAVTLLNVWVASTLPVWSHQIKRDKEAELIFRGMQYAEAIRIYKARYTRYPTSLKQLIEVEPRCIRKLWENPMREDGRWGLVPEGVGTIGGQNNNALNPGQNNPAGGGFGDDGSDGGLFGDDEEGEKGERPGTILSADPEASFGAPPSTVSIRGVYAASPDDAVLRFLSKESLNDWQFTIELYGTQKQGGPANPTLLTPFAAWEIQSNWPEGVVPQTPQPTNAPKQAKPNANVNPQGGGNLNPRPSRPDLRGEGAPTVPNRG